MQTSRCNSLQAVVPTPTGAHERCRAHAGTSVCTTCRHTRLLLTISVLVLLALAAAQLAVTVWHQPTQNLTCPPMIVPRQLPCQALPLGFLEQHPDCANALLQAMNVTNVRVLTYAEWDASWAESRPGIDGNSSPGFVGVSAPAPALQVVAVWNRSW